MRSGVEPGQRVTLRELFEQRFDAMDKAVETALSSMDKRLDSMNEFRSALKDQSSQMMTRPECRVVHKQVDDDLRMLRESKAMLEGKASQLSMNITLAIAIAGLAVSVVALFVK